MKTALIFLLIPLLGLSAQSTGPFVMEFKAIREGIYLGYRPDALRDPVVGNIVIIINEEDVVVYDAGRTLSTGQQVVNKIQELTNNPVSTVVISHGHIDHIGGLQAFLYRYPGVEVICRPETRDYIERRVSLSQYTENLRRRLEERDSLGLSGLKPIEQQQYWDTKQLVQEYQQMEIILPTLTFTGEEMTLYRKDREIRLLWLGHGKTRSDLIIHLPAEKLAIVGDMVTHPIPYGFCSQPEEWAATLEKLLKLEVEEIIPGHGSSICRPGYIARLAALLIEVARQVEAGKAKGMGREALLDRIDIKELQQYFTGGQALKEARFQEWFLEPIVGRILRRD